MPTSRISPKVAARFGLVSISESTRVFLPLKGVECEFAVSGGLVEVLMTQIFRQENRKPLDCEYLFPLPADASVFCCEADINGRVIRAKVRERGEAVKLAAEKKAEGRRVALVEAERENLFTLTLNNLQPDDLILVKLKYIQPLRSLADMPSVDIPFCPGIRYIPGNLLLRSNRGKGIADDTDQVPDASRITPVRIDKDHPDAAFVEIRGTLDAKFMDPASVQSPSHNIVSRPEGETLTVRLSDKGEVPDRDFVLRWREGQPEGLAARAWIREMSQEAYALLEIRAPKASGAPTPMDFYFLVDRSGSMAGVKWEKAALAVQSSVGSLAESDRAMVTLFSTEFNDFAEQPLPPRQLLAESNFRNLGQLQAAGGTELGAALRHVLEVAARHSPDRQKSLILITDAQVGNETTILKIMESAPEFPLHCFGVDVALNDALLLALARQQRGTFHSLNPGDDVARAVTDLAQTIRHPVLKELRLSGGWETAQAWIPPLYSGQVHYLSARSVTKDAIALTARNGDGAAAQIPVASQVTSSEAPYLHWCKNRIQRHIAEGRAAEAVALSEQSNLICPLTAFIAWDEAEKVAVANHALAQPALADTGAGVLYDACLCAPPAPAGAGHARSFLGRNLSPRLTRRAASPPARLDAIHGALPPQPPGRQPPEPMSVVSRIVEHLNTSYLAYPGEPFTSEDRRAAFDKVLEEIRNRLSHPEWEPLGEAILTWAFADPREAIHRSNLVAQLLSRLTSQLNEIMALREELRAYVGQLRGASASLAEGLNRFERMLADGRMDVGALAELLAGAKAGRAQGNPERIESALAKSAQVEKDIHEELATFLQSVGRHSC
ncbi:MAG: VIT domain-containing protein [Limisphaerales bacterium]